MVSVMLLSVSLMTAGLLVVRSSVREVEQYLSNVISIERMRTREIAERGGEWGRSRIARFDDLFQFIRYCVTAENHPVRLPAIPLYLDWLATAEFHHGLSPVVDGRYLAVVAIGSGGAYAQAAARGLIENTELTPEEVVKKSLTIAGDLCIYTNQSHIIEVLKP